MINLSVIGRRGGAFVPHGPPHYIGCVTTTPTTSDRSGDVVQSIPTTSPTEAIAIGHELRGLMLEQSFHQPPCCEDLPRDQVLS